MTKFVLNYIQRGKEKKINLKNLREGPLLRLMTLLRGNSGLLKMFHVRNYK